MYINETIQKHSTNNTKHSKYKCTYYQNTHTVVRTPLHRLTNASLIWIKCVNLQSRITSLHILLSLSYSVLLVAVDGCPTAVDVFSSRMEVKISYNLS